MIAPGARPLKRELGPLVWAVLEDLALDAQADGTGRRVAETSCRQVAEHLGVTPGTAAKALARLRSEGLVDHARQGGPSGRFGLSVYVLAALPGLRVVDGEPLLTTPTSAPPRPVAPRSASPRRTPPRAAARHTAGNATKRRTDTGQLDLLTVDLDSSTQ